MERFLDLSRRDEVVDRVLRDWLLRELRDDLASRITWKLPQLAASVGGLRVRLDAGHPFEVYFLTPVGLGGKFFYEHPVGEAFYSAEAHVVVEHEAEGVKAVLGAARLFWVGTDDPRGYRISEGFDDLLEEVMAGLARWERRDGGGAAPRTRSVSRSRESA